MKARKCMYLPSPVGLVLSVDSVPSGKSTFPKRCNPYAVVATRTDFKAEESNDVRMWSGRSAMEEKYWGSCSIRWEGVFVNIFACLYHFQE